MRHQVAVRKTEIRREIAENGSEEISRDDVFSRLVLANESEAEKLPLDDQEMVSLLAQSDMIANYYTLVIDWQHVCPSVCRTRWVYGKIPQYWVC